MHDEAALASTREQRDLMRHIDESGARLILVGDPQQSQPVGAGGLWNRIEHTTVHHDARAELTHNVRAQDPQDRGDQQAFRDGRHLDALHGYHQRGRVLLADTQQAVEQRALTLAHDDRRNGLSTIVIAQTTNDHLDELNAQAQALRLHDGELGTDGLAIPGRPYRLHAGDDIQIRHGITHPDHGPIRNGTRATITAVDPASEQLTLHIGEDTVILDAGQVTAAEPRLAYVQHPFPAQGATTDTAHLIASEHTTRDGSYVAITRARHRTHIHAVDAEPHPQSGEDPLEQIVEALTATEPVLPSIAFPILEQHASQTFTDRLAARERTAKPEKQAKAIEPETDQGLEP